MSPDAVSCTLQLQRTKAKKVRYFHQHWTLLNAAKSNAESVRIFSRSSNQKLSKIVTEPAALLQTCFVLKAFIMQVYGVR